MDPIANIKEQRELARGLIDALDESEEDINDVKLNNDDVLRLCELVLSLDEWRMRGGFDPYLRD